MKGGARVTVRDVVCKPDAEITKLARQAILGEVHFGIAEDPTSITYSFGLILLGTTFTKAALGKIGILYGTPMQGAYYCNGNPLCGDMGWLHKDDTPRLRAEIARMQEALGMVDE